jgi:hypothetical protein
MESKDFRNLLNNSRVQSDWDTDEILVYTYKKFISKYFQNDKIPELIVTYSNVYETQFKSYPNGCSYITYEIRLGYIISTINDWISKGRLMSDYLIPYIDGNGARYTSRFDEILYLISLLINQKKDNYKLALLIYSSNTRNFEDKGGEKYLSEKVSDVSEKFNAIDTDISNVWLKDIFKLLPPEEDISLISSKRFVLYHELVHALVSAKKITDDEFEEHRKNKISSLTEIQKMYNLNNELISEIKSFLSNDGFVEELICDYNALHEVYSHYTKYNEKVLSLNSIRITQNSMIIFDLIKSTLTGENSMLQLNNQLKARSIFNEYECNKLFLSEKKSIDEYKILFTNSQDYISLNFECIFEIIKNLLKSIDDLKNTEIYKHFPEFESREKIVYDLIGLRSPKWSAEQLSLLEKDRKLYYDSVFYYLCDPNLLKLHSCKNNILDEYKNKLKKLYENPDIKLTKRNWEYEYEKDQQKGYV